ncbi:MAG: hypothetical protein ACOYOJ_04560, partial [Alsobacter sp.]
MRMGSDRTRLGAALAGCLITAGMVAPSHAQQAPSRFLADLPFKENRPTPKTASVLQSELFFQRATQAYLWALPLVNT